MLSSKLAELFSNKLFVRVSTLDSWVLSWLYVYLVYWSWVKDSLMLLPKVA